MKALISLLSFLVALLLSGCLTTSYLTEQHIKTTIETHEENTFSTIKLFTLFQGKPKVGNGNLELTGYKWQDKKGLVISIEKKTISKSALRGLLVAESIFHYIELRAPLKIIC